MAKNEDKVVVKAAEPKEKKIFKGEVISAFTVGFKNPKKYEIGSNFETDNQSVYQDLINKQKIKNGN